MRHTILMFKAALFLFIANSTLQAQNIPSTQDSIRAFKKFQFGIVGESQTGSVKLVHAPFNRNIRADGYVAQSLGLVLEYNVNSRIGFGAQPKLARNNYIIRYTDQDRYYEEEIKTNYLQVPIYAIYTYGYKNSSPFVSFGMTPSFKLSNNESENIQASNIFFEGFVKIGVDIKKQNLDISPFISLNSSFTDIYQYPSEHGTTQTATRLGLAFGLAIVY